MGYFSESVLIHTDEEITKIENIKVGDKIVNKNGEFESVIHIDKLKTPSNLLKITHYFGTDKYFPIICSEDCQILIKNGGTIRFEFAKNIKKGDYICTPKIKPKNIQNKIIDLNDYNIFNFEYDDDYIYEPVVAPRPYKYSPMDVSRKIDTSFSLIENFVHLDCPKKLFSKKPEKLRELFEYVPFNTREQYSDYVKSFRVRKINRFIEIDKTFNQFIGLMYGDGYTKNKSPIYNIALIINSNNFKNVVNRGIFAEIGRRIGVEITENSRFDRGNCIELFIVSKIFSNFVACEMFESKMGKDKIFNKEWFNQNEENLNGLLDGFILSDGHTCEKYIGFSNTSPSLINAVKLLYLMTNNGATAIEYIHPRKCAISTTDNWSKPSMNVRKSLSKIMKDIDLKSDEDYCYLPVKKVIPIDTLENCGYSLTTETDNGFLLNNMIVKAA